MSELYDESHRAYQDGRGTRALADRLEALAHRELDARDRELIESASLFFLATVDERGRPTVSYKGGAPGFVRITAPSELVFPVYDGNGMYLSLGNISSTSNIGMLFIDFAVPRRLRIQGVARVIDRTSLEGFPGAQHLVQVTIEQAFVNCGRYIHNLAGAGLSPHVPDQQGWQPFPEWKRIDVIAEVLPEKDKQRVEEAGGTVAIEEYRGEGDPGPPAPLT